MVSPSTMLAAARCQCSFPVINHPGKCGRCQLSHEEAARMRIRAMDIPYRFFSKGDITWKEQENLAERIDVIVWDAFRSIRDKDKKTNLGEKSVLCYFQETILTKVRNLMFERHHLLLDAQDEKIYKAIDPAALIQFKLQ